MLPSSSPAGGAVASTCGRHRTLRRVSATTGAMVEVDSPVHPDEELHWIETMRHRRFARSQRPCGRQLKLADVLGGRWRALLGWQSAALHCDPRDRWIGGFPLQRRTRLLLRANNPRILLLAPGLASRVLGLSLRLLACDWRARCSTPLLLAQC